MLRSGLKKENGAAGHGGARGCPGAPLVTLRPHVRTYPRVVKRPGHNSYHVKKPGARGMSHRAPPAITLVNLAKPQAAA